MSIFKPLTKYFPMPSAADLEASHLDTNGPFPEFETCTDEKSVRQMLPDFLGRSGKAINGKRATLLRSSEDSNRSTDLESQTSTDASTLLESDVPKRTRLDARVISDAIIGLSDGLTVPFALTAGLSALGNTRVVIFAGLAELCAGAISMGLGGYLGAKSEEESALATLAETRMLVESSPSTALTSISEVFAPYNLPQHLSEDLQFHLAKSPHLVDFLMHFHHNTEIENSRAISCALTIAGGYFLGGFIPLLPYFLVAKEEVTIALWWSLGVMAISLFVFGYGKTCFVSGWKGPQNVWLGTKGGIQMMAVGGVAAGCAMGLVRLFDSFAQL